MHRPPMAGQNGGDRPRPRSALGKSPTGLKSPGGPDEPEMPNERPAAPPDDDSPRRDQFSPQLSGSIVAPPDRHDAIRSSRSGGIFYFCARGPCGVDA